MTLSDGHTNVSDLQNNNLHCYELLLCRKKQQPPLNTYLIIFVTKVIYKIWHTVSYCIQLLHLFKGLLFTKKKSPIFFKMLYFIQKQSSFFMQKKLLFNAKKSCLYCNKIYVFPKLFFFGELKLTFCYETIWKYFQVLITLLLQTTYIFQYMYMTKTSTISIIADVFTIYVVVSEGLLTWKICKLSFWIFIKQVNKRL